MSRTKRERRIQAIADELGVGRRGAVNVMRKRAACAHVWAIRANDKLCTECGATKQTGVLPSDEERKA